MVQFKNEIKGGKSRRVRFNKIDALSLDWNSLIENGSLKEEYQKNGISGVMELTGLKKSSAYILIGRAGLLKESLKKKNEEILRKTFEARLQQLKRIYDWTPQQEFCKLRGKIYFFEKDCKIGESIMYRGHSYFMGYLPEKAVLSFMVERGLKFFIINHKIEPVGNFNGKSHAVAMIPNQSKLG